MAKFPLILSSVCSHAHNHMEYRPYQDVLDDKRNGAAHTADSQTETVRSQARVHLNPPFG